MEEKSNKAAERESTGERERHPRGPVLPERARSECARSTGAVGPPQMPFPEREGGNGAMQRQATLHRSTSLDVEVEVN